MKGQLHVVCSTYVRNLWAVISFYVRHQHAIKVCCVYSAQLGVHRVVVGCCIDPSRNDAASPHYRACPFFVNVNLQLVRRCNELSAASNHFQGFPRHRCNLLLWFTPTSLATSSCKLNLTTICYILFRLYNPKPENPPNPKTLHPNP